MCICVPNSSLPAWPAPFGGGCGLFWQRRPALQSSWGVLFFHSGQNSPGDLPHDAGTCGCSWFWGFSSRSFSTQRSTSRSSLIYLILVFPAFATQRSGMVARAADWGPLETFVYIHNYWISKHKWLPLGPTGTADTICHVNSHSLHGYFFLKGNYHAKTTLGVLTASKLPL